MSESMIIAENWIQWEPVAGLANKYYVSEIRSNIDSGFSVKLLENGNNKNNVKLIFPKSVWCYRSTDEGIMQKTISILNIFYPEKFYSHWTFFKIENSDYLKWLTKKSGGLCESLGLQHFCIITGDEMFDIIAAYEPDVIKNE